MLVGSSAEQRRKKEKRRRKAQTDVQSPVAKIDGEERNKVKRWYASGNR